jgi:shikimate dehydrogenase
MVKKNLIKQFGLIGKNIDYSFSRTYFSSKFEKEKKSKSQLREL